MWPPGSVGWCHNEEVRPMGQGCWTKISCCIRWFDLVSVPLGKPIKQLFLQTCLVDDGPAKGPVVFGFFPAGASRKLQRILFFPVPCEMFGVCVCVPLFQDVRLRYKYHQTTVKKNLTTPSLRDFFRVQLQRNGPEGGGGAPPSGIADFREISTFLWFFKENKQNVRGPLFALWCVITWWSRRQWRSKKMKRLISQELNFFKKNVWLPVSGVNGKIRRGHSRSAILAFPEIIYSAELFGWLGPFSSSSLFQSRNEGAAVPWNGNFHPDKKWIGLADARRNVDWHHLLDRPKRCVGLFIVLPFAWV